MEILIVVSLALLIFITRVINLLNIPIFTDEAIYIRWAQIGLVDPAHRYISLTDGKQPLLTWLMYPMLKVFPDPLFAGRFVSVISAVAAVVGIYLTARELFGKKSAVYGALIYLISPFALIYGRLALMDSLLAAIGVWSIYLSILMVRRIRLDVSFLLGTTIGLGVLTKSSAFFYLYLLPLSLLFFDIKQQKRFSLFIKWSGLALISIIIVQIMYNSLRLSPWFYLIKQKNYSFVLTISEFFKNPFALFIPNLNGLVPILFSYLTMTVSAALVIGIVWGTIKKDIRLIYLFLWFLLPFLGLASFGKVIFPRFILFMTMPIFIIAGYTISRLSVFAFKKMKILLLIPLVVLMLPFYQCYLIIFSPVDAAVPQIDRNQLFDDWPAGYGVREVVAYLQEKSEFSKIVVGTEGTFGLFPAVFEIYLGTNTNVEIHGYWPVSEVPKELLEKSTVYPTYLVFKEKQIIPQDWPINLIARFRRGRGNTYLLFYQVDPTKWKRV